VSNKSDFENFFDLRAEGDRLLRDKKFVQAHYRFRLAHVWALSLARTMTEMMDECMFGIDREMDELKTRVPAKPESDSQ